MGYVLRRELREALGSEITGLQRLVALEIADTASDQTRVSHATVEDLVRWTGAKDGDVLRKIFKRLGEAGWEFRVPIGKGKDGRVLYAVPGKALTFRVPESPQGGTMVPPSADEGGTTVPAEGTAVPPSADEGGTVVPSEGTVVPSEGTVVPSEGTTVPPLSSVPHTSSPLSGAAHIVRSAAVVAEPEREESPLISKIMKDHPGSTADEAAAILDRLQRDSKIHSVPAVVGSAVGRVDIAERLRVYRVDAAKHAETRARQEAAVAARAQAAAQAPVPVPTACACGELADGPRVAGWACERCRAKAADLRAARDAAAAKHRQVARDADSARATAARWAQRVAALPDGPARVAAEERAAAAHEVATAYERRAAELGAALGAEPGRARSPGGSLTRVLQRADGGRAAVAA